MIELATVLILNIPSYIIILKLIHKFISKKFKTCNNEIFKCIWCSDVVIHKNNLYNTGENNVDE